MSKGEQLWKEFVRRLAEASDEDIDPETITRETSLAEEIDLGSMQTFALVLDLEETYDIVVTDEELENLGGNVGDLFDLLESKLQVPANAAST